MTTIKTTLPYHKDWDVYARQTWSRYITREDANGAAIILTDWTAEMEIRRKRGGALVLRLDSEDLVPGIVITAVDGKVAWTLTAAQTAAMNGKLEYDLFMTNPAGDETYCIIEGALNVKQNVTKPAVVTP